MPTTSLKLPEDVKHLAVSAARQQGVTPHAFMVEAIRAAALAAQQRASFVSAAMASRVEAMESGKGYAATDAACAFPDKPSSCRADFRPPAPGKTMSSCLRLL